MKTLKWILIVAGAGSLVGAEFPNVPKWSGEALPVPPEQEAPWKSGTTRLPEAVISVTDLLFSLGMADPRGCEYREVTVSAGLERSVALKTHAWTFKSKGDSGNYAVGWNGLVYPVLDLGKQVNLDADLEPVPVGNFYLASTQESDGLAAKSDEPLRVCLLLRLGKISEAERLWAKLGEIADLDSFVDLSSDWLWWLFNRGVTAHMRAEDDLALVSFRTIHAVAPRISAEAVRRGIPSSPDFHKPKAGDLAVYAEFLEPSPLFLKDQERRRQSRSQPRTFLADKLPADPVLRIRSLIEWFDEIDTQQNEIPGGIWLGFTPIYTEATKIGLPGVDALIDCYEKDRRLTRSVSFSRPWYRDRNPMRVSEVARRALHDILHIDVKTPAGVREYWAKHRNEPAADNGK